MLPPATVNPVVCAVRVKPLYVLPVSADAIFPSAIAVAFQVPVPIVPTEVKLEAVTPEPSVVPFSTEVPLIYKENVFAFLTAAK